jgi:predicted Zn-dependent peptidase
VKRRGIASVAGAYLDQRMHSSLLTMYAYANDAEQTAQELFDALIETVKEYHHTDVQHEVALNRLRTSTAMTLQRASGLADLTAWSTLFWNEPDYPHNVSDEYARCSENEVRELLPGMFLPENCVRVDVIPQA